MHRVNERRSYENSIPVFVFDSTTNRQKVRVISIQVRLSREEVKILFIIYLVARFKHHKTSIKVWKVIEEEERWSLCAKDRKFRRRKRECD